MVEISKKNVVNVLVSDVYSFEEEEAVLDPVISEHLSHFGIDMLQMQNRVSCLCCLTDKHHNSKSQQVNK